MSHEFFLTCNLYAIIYIWLGFGCFCLKVRPYGYPSRSLWQWSVEEPLRPNTRESLGPEEMDKAGRFVHRWMALNGQAPLKSCYCLNGDCGPQCAIIPFKPRGKLRRTCPSMDLPSHGPFGHTHFGHRCESSMPWPELMHLWYLIKPLACHFGDSSFYRGKSHCQ